MKYRKLPWKIEDGPFYPINNADDEYIGIIGEEADAKLAVHRVNTYDQLVEALDFAETFIYIVIKEFPSMKNNEIIMKFQSQIKAALKEAREEK